MTRKNHRSRSAKATQNIKLSVPDIQPQRPRPKVGLLVTNELDQALEQCIETVRRIANDCKAKNRKFRDIEFDFDNDAGLCLANLVSTEEFNDITAISRVTDVFTEPQFFIDGAGSNDIVQGRLGDCWFLSALATASSPNNNLIEKLCVARDEKVGVYGFVFFKNGSWVNVIIDDLLFIDIPKFEELSGAEQQLFQGDKKKYNRTARKGGKNLYFARSGTENETWVPLIEKAYAKLHGDYSSLSGGRAAEALEDLTGGVSSMIRIKDILDTEKFWEEELLHANDDRLFGAGFGKLDTSRSGQTDINVEGLFGGHSYSILKAVDIAGKQFVILRNPWGESEWRGPWSDGSKEWTSEWLARLPEIGHVFGEDGQFVMEYEDFLTHFDDIDKTIMFDSSWKMSMEWVRVPVRPSPSAWSFGDVSCEPITHVIVSAVTLQEPDNFSLVEPTKAIIVLSKLDDRYFKGLERYYYWNLQFLVYKIDEEGGTLIAESEQSLWGSRSVNTETNLEPGDYAVHIRMDVLLKSDIPDMSSFDKRKLARVLTQRSEAQLAASNYDPSSEKENFPIPIKVLVDRERPIADARKKALTEATSSAPTDVVGDSDRADKSIQKDDDGEVESEKLIHMTGEPLSEGKAHAEEQKEKTVAEDNEGKKTDGNYGGLKVSLKNLDSSDSSSSSDEGSGGEGSPKEHDGNKNLNASNVVDGAKSDGGLSAKIFEMSEVFIGLRVYTKGGEKISILGTIKEKAEKLLAVANPTIPQAAVPAP